MYYIFHFIALLILHSISVHMHVYYVYLLMEAFNFVLKLKKIASVNIYLNTFNLTEEGERVLSITTDT